MIGKIFAYFIFLLPFVFFTGTSEAFEFNKLVVVYAATLVISSLWIIKIIQTKKVSWKRTALDYPLLLFIFSQVIATIYSIDPLTSIFGYYTRFNGGLLSTIAYTLLYWSYVNNVSRNEQQKIIHYLVYSSVIISFWAILEKYGYSPSCLILRKEISSDCWVQDVQSRVFATLGQPNWLAAYLAAIIPLAWMKNVKSKQNFFWFGTFMIIFSALLFTKSRSGLLAYIFSYVVFWGMYFRKYLSLAFKYALISAGLIVLLGSPWSKPINEYFNNYQQGEENAEELLITPSSEIRKMVWKGAINVWRDNFWIGTGVETFGFSYFSKRPAEHNITSEWNFTYNKAHNELLNIAANSGIIGIGAFCYIIYVVINKYNYNNASYLSAYLSILITSFFGFLVVTTSLLFFLIPAFMEIENNYSKHKKYKYILDYKALLIGIIGIFGFVGIYRYWLADYNYHKYSMTNNLSYINRSISLNELNPEYKLKLAEYYKNNNSVNESNQIISNLVNNNSGNLNIIRKSAEIYGDLGNGEQKYIDKQIDLLKMLTIKAPTDPRNYYSLAIAYFRLNKIYDGLKQLEIAISLKPNYDKALILYKHYK